MNTLNNILSGVKDVFKNKYSIKVYLICVVFTISMSYFNEFSYLLNTVLVMSYGLILATIFINRSIELIIEIENYKDNKLISIAKNTIRASTFIFTLITMLIMFYFKGV